DSFSIEAPTAQIEEPYVMAGINVMAADTDAAAQREFTVVEQMFQDSQTGQRLLFEQPVDLEQLTGLGPDGNPIMRNNTVGSPQTVHTQLDEFVERTGADELITVTYAYDPAVRDRSYALLAETWF